MKNVKGCLNHKFNFFAFFAFMMFVIVFTGLGFLIIGASVFELISLITG